MRLIEFDGWIDRLEYPTSTEAITRKYGERVLQFQGGSERVNRVFDRVGPEVFATPDEVRMTLYNAVPDVAIGRKGYSDRDPPGVDEVEPLSF